MQPASVTKKTLNIKRLLTSLLTALPMILASFVTITRLEFADPIMNMAKIIVYLFANITFLLMIYSGKVDRYRSILFIATAIFFPISFISTLYAQRGSFMVLHNAEIRECMVPFCHIVIPQTLLSALFKREIIFPGAMIGFHFSISVMIVIWLAASVTLGRGFCSWVCVYGGWEDGCSRLRKKPFIHIKPKKLLLLPFAILLTLVVICTATMSTQYCWWLCPFKAVTEFPEVSSLLRLVQTVIFILLFIGLVIILPLLTKKRTQCSFLCPFGSMQSLINKITPFELRVDREKCVDCKKCIDICPVFAMDEESLQNGRTRITCVKCGKCVDQCPKDAIHYHIKGTRLNIKTGLAKMLFLYIAFLLLATCGGEFMVDAIAKIMRLFV
ncbi:MAG TPA: 4Fe-4S binding protein [Bacillota bacterium]|nr:4Fe-4S binding protein [Bacillota bacterium]